MAVAGAAYARFFGRAANAVRGGWLFGMSFGFALWAAGAVLVLPLLSGGRAPAGSAAVGVALSLMTWGLATGILVPFVHRPLHESLENASKSAAADRQPLPRRTALSSSNDRIRDASRASIHTSSRTVSEASVSAVFIACGVPLASASAMCSACLASIFGGSGGS